mgnify:FL=1
MNIEKLQGLMIQDVEDKVVSVGGVKFKKPKVKEVTENGIKYKVFYTTEYNGNSHNELNNEIELYRKQIS